MTKELLRKVSVLRRRNFSQKIFTDFSLHPSLYSGSALQSGTINKDLKNNKEKTKVRVKMEFLVKGFYKKDLEGSKELKTSKI